MLLREEIADIIMRKVKNPHLGFVTVTDVELSEDLKIARVFVSVMSEGDQGATIEILNSARGLIRSEISKRVRVKFIPVIEIYFAVAAVTEGLILDFPHRHNVARLRTS
jgi:ribosome-binding factor A